MKRESAFREWNGVLFEVAPTGSAVGFGFPYVVKVDGVRLLFSGRCEAGTAHNCMALVGGAAMGNIELDLALGWVKIQELFRKLGATIERNSFSRGDAACDLIGVESRKFLKIKRFVCRAHHRAVFNSVDYDQFVEAFEKARKKSKPEFMRKASEWYDQQTRRGVKRLAKMVVDGVCDTIVFGGGKKACGMQFGRGDRVLRIYDKMTQLQRKHPERLEHMLQVWRCVEGTPVTRVEFQVRGDGLRDLGIQTIEDAIEKLPRLVEYLVNEWCVGCSQYDRKNGIKAVHPLWQRVIDAFTSTPGVDPWEVCESVGGDGASAGDHVKKTPVARAADRELKTSMSYLMRSILRGHGGSLENAADVAQAMRGGVERMLDQIGVDRLFESYGERLVRHWNENGRETSAEGWRVLSPSIDVDSPDIGFVEIQEKLFG